MISDLLSVIFFTSNSNGLCVFFFLHPNGLC